ncbi:MAG: VanW family protein [Tepidanaerobacteraceae bacterium]|nr:VanW family protein [Tepidanaerobacteraceae bacterium]
MVKRIAFFPILLLLCFILIFVNDCTYDKLIPSGIFICDLDVGGLTRDEAEDKLQELAEEIKKEAIILIFCNDRWVFSVSEHVDIDVQQSIDNIFTYTQNKSLLQRVAMRQLLKKEPKRMNLVIKYKENKLRQTFDKLNDAIMIEPLDASFKIYGDIVHIVDDVKGRFLDEGKLRENIIKGICMGNGNLDIPVKQWKADKTKENLKAMEIKTKVAEYSTKFNKSIKGRTENIRLAGEKLNGCLLSPNEVFSFNEIVGERTEEKGYKEAQVFINNQTVSDIGGGVCQVSSTLYNLALLIDLEIIERVNHSLPVSYVPLGRDATVNYNTIDLKFKNNTGSYLLLTSEIVDNKFTVKFFGSEKKYNYTELLSEIIMTIPSPVTIKKDYNIAKGEVKIKEGTLGYKANLWKKYVNEKNGDRLLISKDIYNPTPTILYVGEKVKESKKTDDEFIMDNELPVVHSEN